jgi:flavodoxin
MKTAIIYHSAHHQNTKQLVDAICQTYAVDAFEVPGAQNIPVSSYDLIGFASGIYMSRFHKSLFELVEEYREDLRGKSAFLLFTSGSGNASYQASFAQALAECGCKVRSFYQCRGFDTFGPWKLIGGIAKNHPNEDDIKGALAFYESCIMQK